MAPGKSVRGFESCRPRHTVLGARYPAKVDEYNKQVHDVEKKDYSELVNKLVAIK
jgi:hypothetical protein